MESFTKKQIIEYIHKQDEEGGAWLDSVPMEIQSAFFDNPYVSSKAKIITVLLSHIFTEEERDWMDWLLLEWTYNPQLSIRIDAIEYRFESFETALDKLFELRLINED